ncbi:MAG: L-rhamnose mutarotase [Clostridiaceae bacterium]|jgi:L-rhamnose mutarotase|nr:L-rhamnose mutarotase [Clostridiaceae bacterium]
MERYAWRAKVIEGKLDEYIKRHNEIWPELANLLKKAGIRNYTIWHNNNDLFGYYECEKGVEYAARIQAQSPVVDKWNEYMKDVMVMEMDPVTKAQPLMEQVFLLE